MLDNAALTPHQMARIKHIEAAFVETPDHVDLMGYIRVLHQTGLRTGRVGDPARCMFIVGEVGAGKTILARRYADLANGVAIPNGGKRPVVYCEVQAGGSLRAFVSSILATLGDPLHHKGNLISLTARLLNELRQQQVELLIFDEVQNLGHRTGSSNGNESIELIKRLLNAGVCPILLVGRPEAKSVLAQDHQLVRRSNGLYSVRTYDRDRVEDREAFCCFLAVYEAKLGFKKPSNLSDPRVAYCLQTYSNGVIGRALEVLEKAAQEAVLAQEDHISFERLANAAVPFLACYGKENDNPFDVLLANGLPQAA